VCLVVSLGRLPAQQRAITIASCFRSLQTVSQVANMHSAGGRRGQMEGRWTPTVNELSNHADFHAARFDLPVYGVRANTNDAHGLLLDYISRNTFISALTSTPRRRLSVKSISSSIQSSPTSLGRQGGLSSQLQINVRFFTENV